jgi:hypothetical protein
VLHDMFAVPFGEIGSILGRSPAAAKQLASRARGRIQQADSDRGPDPARQQEVVRAFLAASRDGEPPPAGRAFIQARIRRLSASAG